MSARIPASPGAPTLLVEDLRLALGDIGPLLRQALAANDPTDAYLLGAAGSQVLRDLVEDDPVHLLRAASIVGRAGPRGVRRAVATGASATTRALRAGRGALSTRRDIALDVDRLDAALGGLADGLYAREAKTKSGEAIVGILEDVTGLDAPVVLEAVRQPSCFRSFDQHPADVRELATQVISRYGSNGPPFVVVGVRTSGSYLAPLLGAALRSRGQRSVSCVTLRPGRPPTSAVRALLESLGRSGARAVVIDDPPTSGASLDTVAGDLLRFGFGSDRVTYALALLDGATVPDRLSSFDAVVLAWRDWDIHRRLAPDSVHELLRSSLDPALQIESLTSFELPEGPISRGHVQVGYTAVVVDPRDNTSTSLSLSAEGAGLGFFGRHVVAVSNALSGLVPAVIGFGDGVALRRWLPEESRVRLDSETRVRNAVRYVTSRRAALPALRDAAIAMAGQQPAWEVASRLLAAPYSVAGLAMRSGGLDAAVRTLLAPSQPSVTDGQTGSRSWFEDDGALLKVSFSERSFSNLDLACYDAAYDVAGIALGTTDATLSELARTAFETQTGVRVDPERWLLYQLVHLWDLHRLDQLDAHDAEVTMARAWQDWTRARLLGTTLDRGTGPWCALDVDGVLETSRLGAPVLTPSAAAGLRALVAHNYGIVLATGRSLPELQNRCSRYGLAGGVAEYGAVAYNHRSGEVRELLDDEARASLAAGREALALLDGVRVASGYGSSIRAYRINEGGGRVCPDPASIEGVLASTGGRLQAHPGIAQVDFVTPGVDKASGLDALFAMLGAAGAAPALVVGDSRADLPMLRMAERGFVPAHARHLASDSLAATRHPYQRGFADAVAAVLGHAPGGCDGCIGDVASTDGASMLSALLAGLEGGREHGVAAIPEILRFARRVRRAGTAARR